MCVTRAAVCTYDKESGEGRGGDGGDIDAVVFVVVLSCLAHLT